MWTLTSGPSRAYLVVSSADGQIAAKFQVSHPTVCIRDKKSPTAGIFAWEKKHGGKLDSSKSNWWGKQLQKAYKMAQ